MAANRGASSATNASLASRPTTALSRVLDKFSTVSGINLTHPLHGISANTNLTADRNSKSPAPVMAYALQAKIGKIIKAETKSKNLKALLINDLRVWSSLIPNVECETTINEFASLLLSETDAATTVIEKLDQMRLNLVDVHEREKKKHDLSISKDKLLRQLKDLESKYGAAASGSTLIKEKLEETVCSLEVVELQYLRSINRNLKESMIDYLICLQAVAATLSSATLDYYGCLLAIEQGLLQPHKNSTALHNNSHITNLRQQQRKASPIQLLGAKTRLGSAFTPENDMRPLEKPPTVSDSMPQNGSQRMPADLDRDRATPSRGSSPADHARTHSFGESRESLRLQSYIPTERWA